MTRAAARAATLVAGAGGAVVAYGVGVERYRYAIREHVLPVLPQGSPDLRVLHLSDLHMAPWQRRKQAFVRSLADLAPDLVVDTGDNLGHRIGLLGLEAALDPFAGVPGLYVFGSNDFWSPVPKNPFAYLAHASRPAPNPRRLDTAALKAHLDGLGWTDLDNAAARIVVRGVPIDAFGVNDPHREYDRLDALAAPLARLRRRKVQAAVTLGVAHAPYRRVLDAFVDRGADVLLAGHTHGGQVCLPGGRALVANCDLPLDQVRGLSSWAHGGRTAALNVSAGLGTSIYAPVRFACRPEVSLLVLTAAAA